MSRTLQTPDVAQTIEQPRFLNTLSRLPGFRQALTVVTGATRALMMAALVSGASACNVLNCDDPNQADQCDLDGDGFPGSLDCNDREVNAHNGAREIPYNDIDEDCNGIENDRDVDGDGFDSVAVEGGDDCHDGNPRVNPAEPELCNGSDDNCNDEIDEVRNLAEGEGEYFGADQTGAPDGGPDGVADNCNEDPIFACREPDPINIPGGGEPVGFAPCPE